MRKEKLEQLEQEGMEVLESYIIVGKNSLNKKYNDYYFAKKFEFDKSTKKYYLKEFRTVDDNLDQFKCVQIEIITWFYIKIKDNIQKLYSGISQEEFDYYIASRIAEKIKDLKKFPITEYNIIDSYDHIFYDKNQFNFISIARERDNYSVYIQQIVKPTRYI